METRKQPHRSGTIPRGWLSPRQVPTQDDLEELTFIAMGANHGSSLAPVSPQCWPTKISAPNVAPLFADIAALDKKIEQAQSDLEHCSPGTGRRWSLINTVARLNDERRQLYEKFIYGP